MKAAHEYDMSYIKESQTERICCVCLVNCSSFSYWMRWSEETKLNGTRTMRCTSAYFASAYPKGFQRLEQYILSLSVWLEVHNVVGRFSCSLCFIHHALLVLHTFTIDKVHTWSTYTILPKELSCFTTSPFKCCSCQVIPLQRCICKGEHVLLVQTSASHLSALKSYVANPIPNLSPNSR